MDSNEPTEKELASARTYSPARVALVLLGLAIAAAWFLMR